MMNAASKLAELCTQAARDGIEFPVIWDTILRKNGLVIGPPVQTFEDGRPHLEIRLSNGYWLRYCSQSNDFSLRRAALHRAF